MDKAIAKPWLSLQCQMIPGVRHAVFAADCTVDGAFATLESWPEGVDAPAAVVAVMNAAIASENVEVRQNSQAEQPADLSTWIVACPLRRGGLVCGAVAVEVGGIDETQVPVITRLMLWGSAWPAFLADRDTARDNRPADPALMITSALLETKRLSTATAAAVTALVSACEVDDAAMALLDSNRMRLVALSGRAVFDDRSDTARAFERAMDEAFDQHATVIWPLHNVPAHDPTVSLITDAHEHLAGNEQSTCTVLLRAHKQVIGGLTLSRSKEQLFKAIDVERFENLAGILGPALETRRLADQGVLVRASDVMSTWARRLFGAGNLRLKSIAISCLALFAFVSLATGSYKVSAPAVLEGTIERDLVAPVDGYVAEAHVRAGARVLAGDVLATLDDKPLQLERGRLLGQRDKLTNEYNQALGALDHGATRVLAAQIRQAESQLALVEGELERTRIVAPFDGLIVSGDLSQSLGSPVSRGDSLFRLAPLDGYRVIVEIDESDVQVVQAGAGGQLVLAAFPKERFDVRVERVNGMAISTDGRNVLEVESALLGASEHLRPGMKGVARIDAGRARLIWIWTHPLVERLHLWWWAFSPVA